MKSVSILGSTGSIGLSTLSVVDSLPDRFVVAGLAAGRDLEGLFDLELDREKNQYETGQKGGIPPNSARRKPTKRFRS